MDPFLRYLSMLSLVTSPDKRSLLMGYRKQKEEFYPDMPAWPGGRVEGLEESKARMVIECREEAGVEIVIAKAVLLGECYFQRDGFPVTQYCFAVPALNGDYLKETKELRDISYISPKVFFEIVPDEGYFRNYHAFVNNAISIGMLLE